MKKKRKRNEKETKKKNIYKWQRTRDEFRTEPRSDFCIDLCCCFCALWFRCNVQNVVQIRSIRDMEAKPIRCLLFQKFKRKWFFHRVKHNLHLAGACMHVYNVVYLCTTIRFISFASFRILCAMFSFYIFFNRNRIFSDDIQHHSRRYSTERHTHTHTRWMSVCFCTPSRTHKHFFGAFGFLHLVSFPYYRSLFFLLIYYKNKMEFQ